AQYGSSKLIFYETAIVVPPATLSLTAPTPDLLYPLTATAGTPATSIKVNVFGNGGVPFVSLKLVGTPPANPPAGAPVQLVKCSEAQTVPEYQTFTDAAGNATCTPIFTYPNAALGDKTGGNLTFKVVVGANYSFGPFTYNI